MIHRIGRWFQVRPGEGPLVAVAGGLLAVATGVVVLLRSVNDAIFLDTYGPSLLLYAFAASSLAMTVTSLAYGALSARADRRRLALATPAVFALILIVCRALMGLHLPGYLFAQYIGVSILAGLTPILAWNVVRSASDARQVRRLMPLFIALASAGAAVAGVGTRGLAGVTGTDNLLLLGAGLLAGVVALTGACRTAFESAPPRRASREGFWADARKGIGLIHRNALMRYTTISGALAFVVVTMIDYQFKASLRERFNRDEMTGFLGNYQAVANVVTLVFQLALSGWLVNRLGITACFTARPAVVIALSAATLILPGFWPFVAVRFADWVLTLAWYELGTNIVYAPIPAERSSRIKLTQDGAIKPLVIVVTSLALLPLTRGMALASLSWIVLGVAVVWLLSGLPVRRHYLHELARAIERRLLDADAAAPLVGPGDAATTACLARAVAGGDVDTIRFALEVAREAGTPALWGPLRPCLDHADEDVRCRAAAALIRVDAGRTVPLLRERLQRGDASAAEAATLLRCLTEAEDADSLDLSYRYVGDERLPVRAEAIIMLFRLGGLDGLVAAVEQLSALRRGGERDRAALAEIIGRLGLGRMDRTLLPLLRDADREVRAAAIRAAAHVGSERMLDEVAGRLCEGDLREVCEAALRAAGPRGVRAVLRLKATAPPTALAASLSRILRGHPTAESLDLLYAWLTSDSADVRHQAAACLVSLKEAGIRFDAAAARAFFASELHNALVLHAVAARCDGLLQRALRQRLDAATARLFLALQAIHDTHDLRNARAAIESGDPRLKASALEFLENTLDAEQEKPFVLLLEHPDDATVYTRAAPVLGLPPLRDDAIDDLARGDPWLDVLRGRSGRLGLDPRRLDAAMRLSNRPLFDGLGIEALYAVAERGEFRRYGPGEALRQHGETAGACFLVLAGRIESAGSASNDPPTVLNGFGELGLFTGGAADPDVRSTTDTECFVLSREAMRALITEDPSIAAAATAFLLRELRGASDEESRRRQAAQEAGRC